MFLFRKWRSGLVSLGIALLFLGIGGMSRAQAPIEFNRDIKPIFSDHCYACHGPDDNKRKAGLRLDLEESAFQELKSGNRAIVKGDLEKSILLHRIESSDEDEVMPPPKSGKPLTPEKIRLLKQWIKEGAPWQNHWSFIPPSRSELPEVKDKSWARNPVDRFTQARMEAAGLSPNPEADKTTLLRRVTFDLTGLPPTISEVDAFLADGSSDAYEKVVDRLLAAPPYGERMAQHWLDLSRYADTSGYHFDGVRFMWLWRDWVIEAFNKNQRFDQFTIEQLAGDLLPNPNQAQRIATGFVRNNMTNDEGGADPDEYLNKYVVDRVNTVGSVWLGMTVGCAECHDHKFDPLKSREFYQLYAYFHNVPEKGLDRIRTDNPPPRLPVPTAEQAVKFVEADFALKDAEKTLQDKTNELGETQEKWERETEIPKLNETGLAARIILDEALVAERGPWRNTGRLANTNNVDYAESRLGKGLKLNGKNHVLFDDLAAYDRTNSFSFSAWVKFESKDGCVLSKMEKDPSYRGFDLLVSDARFNVHLIHKWPDNALKVKTRDQFPQNQWLHVTVSYDGSSKASGVKIFVNGKAKDLEAEVDKLSDSIATTEPVRIGSRHSAGPYSGLLDDIRFYDRTLAEPDAQALTLHGYGPVLAKSRGTRGAEERADLARFYKENHAVDFLRAEAALAKARKTKEEFYTKIPTSLIMEEMDPPRKTHLLVRGDFRKKGEEVSAATPAFLPALQEAPPNRLGLAKWLVAKENPLTARVAVNRYWALFFGAGLVRTLNDFGAQGEWPSHPALLDWLAVQFQQGGSFSHRFGADGQSVTISSEPWDVKGFVRMLVTSATYRQSPAVSKEKQERDPENRLLARAPRLRLDAEFVRDNALAVSGLLNRKMGGPSVKPYQPPGIWDGVDATYNQDKGDLLYRRGLYVFWRRSAHYPSFATFDAPNREVCTVMRQRTQTPLQSLVLMNDPVYVEAARALAQRVAGEVSGDLEERLSRAFRHALGRKPAPEEIEILRQTYSVQLENFKADPKSAEELLKVGESPLTVKAEAPELAALTSVANVLLNLNETITK